MRVGQQRVLWKVLADSHVGRWRAAASGGHSGGAGLRFGQGGDTARDLKVGGERGRRFDARQRPLHLVQIGLRGTAGVQEIHLNPGLRRGGGSG